MWAPSVCRINASSEPCPGSTASLHQTSRTLSFGAHLQTTKCCIEPMLSNMDEEGKTAKLGYYYLWGLPQRNQKNCNSISVCSDARGMQNNSMRAFARLSIFQKTQETHISASRTHTQHMKQDDSTWNFPPTTKLNANMPCYLSARLFQGFNY